MLTLLDQVALQRAEWTSPTRSRWRISVRQIERLGCTDPLFRYLRLRYGAPVDETGRGRARSARARPRHFGIPTMTP